MALGYFPVVPLLLLLESAKITGETTSQVTTSPPTSMSTSEPRNFTSVPDTTGGMNTTTPALKTTEFVPSSVALLSDTTSPWSTVGETSLPGGATTLLSSSSPEGSNPFGTSDVTTSSSSLAMISISSTAFGGPSEEGTTQPTESTMLVISPTTENTSSIPRSPTPQDKMTSEGPLTTISTTSPAETTSEKHASSPPTTTETMKFSSSSVPLPPSSLATSTRPSATSGVGDTTGSSEVTMTSEAEISSWWPGSSLSSTYSSVTQDRSTPKATSTGLLPGRSSLGLSTPSSTTPSSEGPAIKTTVVPATTISPSAFPSLPQTAEATTEVTTSPPTSMSTSEPHHFTSVSDTTGGMKTTTPALKSTEFFPSSVALLSDTTSPWRTLGETSLPGGATTLLYSSSSEGSTPAGTADVTASSSSLAMTSISSTAFGGPSEVGTTRPTESTMLVISSTTEDTISISCSPTPQDKMTSEDVSTTSQAETISTTSQAETTSEKHASSPPTTTETMTISPSSVPLPTSSLATSALLSATSGVGDTTGSSEVTMTSEAEITSWWPGSSLSSTYSSVTQERSTPKDTSTGLLFSNPGRSSLGLSTPSSSEGPATTMTVVPSITTSPSAFTSPSEEGTTVPSESTMLVIRSTTQEMNSSSRSPTPQDKMTSEGPLTPISTTSPVETMSEKHASSLPLTTETITTSPLFPLLISTLVTSTPGLGNTTGSSAVTMTSEAEITSWWPGSSLSSTYSSVTQDRSTPKATSVGLLSSNPGRSSLGLTGPSSTNPTSQSPAMTLKVISSISPSPSASEGLSKAPAGNRFILSVRFSTPLNMADLSVRRAMLKWLDHELQAKFPVGNFHLTWMG